MADSNPSRAEAIREQLSEILFGDDEHSTAQCLSELRRRKEIDARLEAWIAEPGSLRHCARSAVGVLLRDYRTGGEWFARPDVGDRCAQLEAVLRQAGAL